MNPIDCLQWAKAEIREMPTSWAKSYRPIQGCTDTGGLALEELCCPIFEVDPEEPKRRRYRTFENAWKRFSSLPRHPLPQDAASLLQEISMSGVLSDSPEFDLPYVATAGTLARVGRFPEAEASLETAFRNCPVRSALCETMGDVHLWQGKPRCFGWYMQACHMGYESYAPYLLLSEAAATLGLTEIRIRLLNAVDCINSSLPRLSTSSDTKSLTLKDKARLTQAFWKFVEYADIYLPPVDALPPIEDERQRSIQAILVRGDPHGPPPSFRVSSRAFARQEKTG